MGKINKNIILYLMVISLIFFINPVSGDFACPGFECGDLDDYTISGVYGTVYVGSEYKYTGDYGAEINITPIYNQDSRVAMYQRDINLTGNNYISWDMRIVSMNRDPSDTQYITVTETDSDPIYYQWIQPHVTGWEHYEVSLQGQTGLRNMNFRFEDFDWDMSSTFIVYIDNIHVTTNSTIPPNSTINFYPSLTNTTPTHVNFSISSEDECTEYGLYIYRNVSGISTYIDFVGWMYDEEGSAPIEISEYGANCTYYAKLVDLGPSQKGVLTTCEREYIFNGSEVDPFPTPDPTPDITPLPTFTPPPTPIPPDTPVTGNNTLNMTWLTGYYNLVDSVCNGLFHPIYNMTSYLMMPINILSGTITGFMNQMQLSFSITTSGIVIASGLLNLIFTAFPDKILNVMTYYLIWILILLFVKGDT